MIIGKWVFKSFCGKLMDFLNICVGLKVYSKVKGKLIITAKMFVIVLYRVYLDYG